MNADNFKEWCQRHNIHILDTDKRAYRWTKQNIKFFQDPADYNLIHEKRLRWRLNLFTPLKLLSVN